MVVMLLVLVLVLMVMLVLVRLEVMVMLMLVVLGDAGAVMVAQPYYERETMMAMVMGRLISTASTRRLVMTGRGYATPPGRAGGTSARQGLEAPFPAQVE